MCVQVTHMKIQAITSKDQRARTRTKNQQMLNTRALPCFGALSQGKTPIAALAYSLIMWKSQVQRCSLSCMEEQGFPIRPSQRLGSCDPGISWLEMAVNSDLDLDKRFGSGLQQVSCSARDFSLAPVPSPSSATRLGIAGSPSRSGLAPPGLHQLTPSLPGCLAATLFTFDSNMPTRSRLPSLETRISP